MTYLLFWRFVKNSTSVVSWYKHGKFKLGNRLGCGSVLGVPLILAGNQLCNVLDSQAKFWIEILAIAHGLHWGGCFRNTNDTNAFCVGPNHSYTPSHCFRSCFVIPFCCKMR